MVLFQTIKVKISNFHHKNQYIFACMEFPMRIYGNVTHTDVIMFLQ